VRDALAGRVVYDIDLATPRQPEEVMRALATAGIRAVPTGFEHGTITAVVDGKGIEITTLRRDVEPDGRHARVEFTDDWREDAARRDFTMNALSMRRDGAVFDYFGGIGDLRAGRVRFVGDAAQRIAEDYLRILRFFRFFARYGRGVPDPDAASAIGYGLAGLAGLSAERVWSELKRILAAPDPVAALKLMAELGVLEAVLPEGADPAPLTRLVASRAPVDPLLRLTALFTGDVDALADRLKLANDERGRLAALRASPSPQPRDNEATLRRMLADTEPGVLIDRIWLRGGDAPGWAELRARIAAMPRPVFPLEGRDVLALGLAPGPRVGELLREVRAWWMDLGCTPDAAACRRELQARVGGADSGRNSSAFRGS
jgi:poly(A) polymerase